MMLSEPDGSCRVDPNSPYVPDRGTTSHLRTVACGAPHSHIMTRTRKGGGACTRLYSCTVPHCIYLPVYICLSSVLLGAALSIVLYAFTR